MKKAKAGFSLVELMVVVVILGIFMIIAVPNYLNQAWRAKERKALFNLKQMAEAQKMFWHEHDALGNSIADSMEDLNADGFYNDASYATNGEETDLKDYIGFSEDDGDWNYSIISGDQTTFILEAQYLKLDSYAGRWIRMDELGDTADNY